MKNEFLLTYSVNSDGSSQADMDANTVRSKIDDYLSMDEDIDDVRKLDAVETTITGVITVKSSMEIYKISDVKEFIGRSVKKLIKDYDIKKSRLEIHCAILVHGIKKTIEFQV